ncbi:MAG: aspartate aminotransferase family protein [Salinirussus sp.]
MALDPSLERELSPKGVLTGGDLAPPGETLVIEEGHGATVTDVEGDEYIDYKLGSGPMIVGHAHPHVVEALHERVDKGTTFYGQNPEAPKLAKRIVDAVPCGDAIQFYSTGTEATYEALRIARAFTGNDLILKFEGGFHGWHDQALVSSNHSGDRVFEVEPPDGTIDTAGMVPGAAESTIVAPWNDLERTTSILEAHSDNLAGVIAEPVQRNLAPADGFHEGVRALCDEHDVPLIWDEVVTGFRLAWGGGQEEYGVEPDLATYGKAIGGGTPVSALVGDRELLSLVDPTLSPRDGGVQSRGTLNGNPLGMVAGQATLDILEQPGTYEGLWEYADRLRGLFEDVIDDSSLSGMAVGDGPVVDYVLTEQSAVENWRDLLACDAETKKAIDAELFDQGVLKYQGGKIYLSTEHGDAEFDRTAEAFKEAVRRIDT